MVDARGALRWWWSTSPHPGAIAVAQVAGSPADVERALEALCARRAPGVGGVAWRRFGEIDDGVVARVAAGHALVMPHGGPRIRQRLDARMAELGATALDGAQETDAHYPEAADDLERRMLAALARAASPLAIELLAAQPARWRAQGAPGAGTERDRRLRRLRAAFNGGLCTSLGPLGVVSLRLGAPGHGLNRGAHAAQVPVRQGPVTVVDRRFVERAHARGLHVHVWTIDDADEMRRLLDLGVDGLMTDRPAVLRAVLEERGAWQ